MPGYHPMYGRRGPSVGGDPQVAELLTRTVDNQIKTVQRFDATIKELVTNKVTPWTAPIPTMAITHAEWLAATLWQAATCYLDGVVLERESDDLPVALYTECDTICDLASDMTKQAISLRSELNQGSRPVNASLVSLPSLNINGAGYAGIWRAFEAIQMQVVNDLEQIKRLGISKQMTDVYQTARTAVQPKVDVFDYLRSSWQSSSPDSRKQLVREAFPIATELFAIGQQLWTPYLFGQVYTVALRYKPTLDDLELGFDPWCLSDPAKQKEHEVQSESKDSLVAFWGSIVSPAKAYQLSEQVRAAQLRGLIRRRTGRGYNLTPWPSQYLVRFPLQLGERTFATGDLIVFYAVEEPDGVTIEIRRTGKVSSTLEMLGQQV